MWNEEFEEGELVTSLGTVAGSCKLERRPLDLLCETRRPPGQGILCGCAISWP